MFVFDRTGGIYSQMIITLHGTMYLRSANSSSWREWTTYLTNTQVSAAIDEKLAEAKENGDFKGEDGASPVRGVDYWTKEDQESIVQQVIEALGTPVFGTVDEDNNITLSGDLASGTYTVKYENADGSLTAIGTLTPISGAVAYTNQLPIATDADGSVYNETGYKFGVRWSTSSSAEVAYDNCYLSGYIPVSADDIVRLKNIKMLFDEDDGYRCAVSFFSDYGVYAGYVNCNSNIDMVSPVWEDDNLVQFTSLASGYFRIAASYLGADSVITVNEVIG